MVELNETQFKYLAKMPGWYSFLRDHYRECSKDMVRSLPERAMLPSQSVPYGSEEK